MSSSSTGASSSPTVRHVDPVTTTVTAVKPSSASSTSDNNNSKNNSGGGGNTMEAMAAQITKDKAHREQAEAIYKEKGNAGVQSVLQKLIQDTKKIESDLALKRKRVEKDHVARMNQNHETTTILAKCRVTEAQCAQMAESARTWPERKEKKVAELKETMIRIRGNVDKEADKLSAEMDEKEAKNNEMDAENEKLQVEFDELKGKLDAEFAAYQDRHKIHDDRTTLLRQSLEAAQEKTNHLRAEAMVYGRELHTIEEQIVGYTETCAMYKDKFGQLENTAMSKSQIEEAINKQKSSIRIQIDAIEKDKKLDLAEKIKYDNDAKVLRQKIQQLKKKIGPADKAKYQAEAKYREAVQANLKKEQQM